MAHLSDCGFISRSCRFDGRSRAGLRLWASHGPIGPSARAFVHPVARLCVMVLALSQSLWGEVVESVPAQFDAETERAIALEQSVVAARQGIRSGEADAIYKGHSGNDVRRWKLWFRGDKLRMEQFPTALEQPAKIVRSDGHIYHKQVGMHEKTGQLSPGNAEIHPDDWNGTMLFDLRRLGITLTSTGGLHSISDWNHTLGTRQRLRSTIADVELNGRAVKLITRFGLGGRVGKFWIDEGRGLSLIRAEHTITHRGQVIADVFVVDLGQFDGVWFPKHVSLLRTVDGIGPSAETITLENVRLNQGIDEHLFTLASVGVEAGETVNVRPKPAGPMMPIWDGTKLVEAGSPLMPAVKREPVSYLRNWFIVANLLFGAACLGIYLWKRKLAR